MGDVVDIVSYQPHMTGKAKCAACGHEWTSVALVGSYNLECPDCHADQGVWRQGVRKTENWQCSCGCDTFCMTRNDIYCSYCGKTQDAPNG